MQGARRLHFSLAIIGRPIIIRRMDATASKESISAKSLPTKVRRGLLVLFILAWIGCNGPAPPTTNPVQRLDVDQFDRLITAEGFNGLVVVFATWCAPCREELPELATIYRSNKPENVQIIALSLDESDARTVQHLVDELKLPFAVYHVGMQALVKYKIIGVPTMMVVKEGRILEMIPGQQSPGELVAKIKMLSGGRS
ncbi:MAG: TlpA disulfide reductase family protein [Desulfatitalea sp.]